MKNIMKIGIIIVDVINEENIKFINIKREFPIGKIFLLIIISYKN